MSFNPDASKQAKEIMFSRKLKKLNHANSTFNNSDVLQVPTHKYLGFILDEI
mgnify:CR=1 FL=1